MVNEQIRIIEKEIQECLKEGNEDICKSIIECLGGGKHIFVAGGGRTGYIMRGFAMRLMQAGMECHWVGDTSTPAAKTGDILVIGSGSGETEVLKCYANTAKQKGLSLILFTATSSSSLGKMADIVIEIPASTKFGYDGKRNTVQPMGALFEQALMVLLDALILEMMENGMILEKTMKMRHANLE